MRRLFSRLSLTPRILGLLVLGFALIAALFFHLSDGLLERVMLEQSKQQTRVFLLGLENEIQATGKGLDPASVQLVLERGEKTASDLGFSLHRLYVFDPAGRIIAHVGGHADRVSLEGPYIAALRDDKPYLGDEIETVVEDGVPIKKIDFVFPLHLDNRVTAGIEAEINLEQTLLMVARLDNEYEHSFVVALAVTGTLVIAAFWLVIRAYLISPIRRLGKTTSEIAKGNLKTRAEGLVADEIGELGNSVNRMAESLEQLMEEQERAYLQSLQSLAAALSAKDEYTARHSARVAKYSVLLGKRLSLTERELKLLKQGALMHDLGKIGIPDSILHKPGPLTDAEYETMRNHPVATAEIMRPLKRFKEFADIAAWHHERWDGKGYPDGLKGEQIPLLARIVAIADTWDAMTGDRVYRRGMPVEAAIAVMEREKDLGQWDPHLLGVFVEMLRCEQEFHHQVELDAGTVA
jgi:putative nucleotidyltransferase with HDIG domain